ncbi:MAG: TrkH family potassium uptake protein [Candidatus Omnitrophica bacterium]|nr:TrkH family potassium uptake protein [Candidatus Omnitrophota bacterium]
MPEKKSNIHKLLDLATIITGAISVIFLLMQWGMPLQGKEPLFNIADNCVLVMFIVIVSLRFLSMPSKKEYLKKYWLDLLVCIPYIQFFHGLKTARLWFILRQGSIIFRAMRRDKIGEKLINLLGLKPAHLLIASFMMTILLGTFLLTLPIATRQGVGMNFVDALFTATSATCVTGLAIQDTGTFFSLFGQLVILAMIQVGALGIMTFSVTLALAAGKKISNKETIAMQDVLDHGSVIGIKELIRFIAMMTLVIEFIGTMVLFKGFQPHISDPVRCLYAAMFHSVSAFCNAGFSLFPDSLINFSSEPMIIVSIALLIIFGGLGFVVVKDLWSLFITRERPASLGLRLHTKLVLTMTIVLIIAGTAVIFFAERGAALQGMPMSQKILASFFQSVTARTAGFNSVDIGKLTNSGIFSIIVLMFIGASAGSTGGGIKTTTLWVLIQAFVSSLRNKDDINIFKRKIPEAVVLKSVSVFMLSLGLIIVFMYLVALFEPLPFRDIIFEVVSAFGTVGLSCGITAQMHVPGKLLITLLMFAGRLGPLTIVLAFSGYQRRINYTYAEERVLVG